MCVSRCVVCCSLRSLSCVVCCLLLGVRCLLFVVGWCCRLCFLLFSVGILYDVTCCVLLDRVVCFCCMLLLFVDVCSVVLRDVGWFVFFRGYLLLFGVACCLKLTV